MAKKSGTFLTVRQITRRNLISMGLLVLLLIGVNLVTYHFLTGQARRQAQISLERLDAVEQMLGQLGRLQVVEREMALAALQRDTVRVDERGALLTGQLQLVADQLDALTALVLPPMQTQGLAEYWLRRLQQLLRLERPDYNRYQNERLVELLTDIFTSLKATLEETAQDLGQGARPEELAGQFAAYTQDVREFMGNLEQLRTNLVRTLQLQQRLTKQNRIYYLGVSLVVFLFGLVVLTVVRWNRRLVASTQLLRQGIDRIQRADFTEMQLQPKDEIAAAALHFQQSIGQYKDAILADAERETTQEHLIGFLEVVSEAADGDLTLKAPVTADAFGSVADAYNLMVESLAELLKETRRNAQDVGVQSRNLIQIFQEMEMGGETQSRQVEQATQAVQRSATAAQDISDKAELAQNVASLVDQATTGGHRLVNDNIEGMQLIRVTVQVINKKMKSLSERLLEIGTIAQLISEIATRTTILAMNASIEASRAGEQGRGFLVISDEIKRLADKSAEATKQINGIIKSIQTEAGEVTASLDEETRTVELQTRLAQDTGEAFHAIQEATGQSRQVVNEISQLSRQQLEMNRNVEQAMRKVAEISELTLRQVRDSAAITTGLTEQSGELLASIETFRLPEDADTSSL